MNSLERLSTHIPAAYEVLQWAGLQRRRNRMNRIARQAGLLGAGAAIGAGAAMLLAPRSGAETRKRLGLKAKQASEYVKSVAPISDSLAPNSDGASRPPTAAPDRHAEVLNA